VLNRVFFAPLGGATTLGNANWGLWRAQANGWRTMQLVGKMTWYCVGGGGACYRAAPNFNVGGRSRGGTAGMCAGREN
jgi:hypothetical protein